MTEPRSYWQLDDKAQTFVEDRRSLIPLISEQEWICRKLLGEARKVERFLDLGCGAGAMAQMLLEVFPMARGTLVDFSEPMLAQARSSLGQQGHSVLFADLADPSWGRVVGDQRFDAIVSGLAIHHLPDERKRALYAEVFDLLEPGGVFINLEHVASGPLGGDIFEDEFAARVAGQARERGKDPDAVVAAFLDSARDEDILASPAEQCDWLQGTGFEGADQYFRWFELAVIAAKKPEGRG